MKKSMKILALVMAFVLTVVATVGATVAWLTAEAEPKKNVFTAGNVAIELDEEVGVDGTGAVVSEVIDDEGVLVGHKYEGAMPGDYLIKKPTVTNTGSAPAYVAITVKLNNALQLDKAIDQVYEKLGYTEEQIQAVYDDVFTGWGLNHTKIDADGNATGMRLTITGDDMPEKVLHVDSVKTITDYAQTYKGNWFGANTNEFGKKGFYTSDMGKYEIKYVYYALLQPGESVTVFEGLQVPSYFDNNQIKMFDGLTIDVSAVAIQEDNIPNAQYAFAYYYGVEDTMVLPTLVNSAEELQAAVDAAANGEVILIGADITGDVTVTQKPNVKFTIDGNGKNFAGVITVDGKSATYTTAGLTIKNLTFKPADPADDVCISMGDGTNATRYICNLTVSGCTFDVPGAVGIKSYTGGDKNVRIIDCTATANAHSLAQLKGVDGVYVEGCTVNAVRGLNLNNSVNIKIDNSVFDVQKYAVRFGESANSVQEVFEITNCVLTSQNVDGDAAIVLRAGAADAQLILTDTTINATLDIVRN